jgi:hypothetical protein
MFSKTKENQRFVFLDDFGDELVAVAVAAVAVAEVAADPDALIFPATTKKLSMLLFSLLLFSDKEVVVVVIFFADIDVGTLSSFIPSRLFISRSVTQILRKNNYIFRKDVSLDARILSSTRRKDLFTTARQTKGTFLATFFFFLFFILARYVLFFPGTRPPANWNIKSAR